MAGENASSLLFGNLQWHVGTKQRETALFGFSEIARHFAGCRELMSVQGFDRNFEAFG